MIVRSETGILVGGIARAGAPSGTPPGSGTALRSVCFLGPPKSRQPGRPSRSCGDVWSLSTGPGVGRGQSPRSPCWRGWARLGPLPAPLHSALGGNDSNATPRVHPLVRRVGSTVLRSVRPGPECAHSRQLARAQPQTVAPIRASLALPAPWRSVEPTPEQAGPRRAQLHPPAPPSSLPAPHHRALRVLGATR